MKIVRNIRNTLIVTLIVGVQMPLVASAQDTMLETLNLTFGTYAFEKPTVMVKKFRPILDVVEERLGKRLSRDVKIKMRIAPTYPEAVRDIAKGRVDFGRYGQAAYVLAKAANRQVTVLAAEGDNRKKSFKSVIAARTDTGIRTIDDLHGHSFAFGDEFSTSGRYMPQAFLAKNGVTKSKLSKIAYLNRHDHVVWSISNGAFDAGAMSERSFADAVQRGARLRPIAYFSNVTRPWLARAGLGDALSDSIRETLISLRGVKVLDRIKKDCFLPGADSDYERARSAIIENWKFFAGDMSPDDGDRS